MKINANGTEISVVLNNSNTSDYISINDIAKYSNPENPRYVIQNWMRNKNTIEFLGTWETLYNKNFNRVQFDTFKNDADLNRFITTPQKWITSTNAIGIISKAGRYGGTYAHSDIAFEFASWISPEFKLYIIKDYQRFKQDKVQRQSIGWDTKRELSKVNYKIHATTISTSPLMPDISCELIAGRAEDVLKTTPGSECALNALAIDNPLEYALITQTEVELYVRIRPYYELVEFVSTIPGITELNSTIVLAETCIDMAVFDDAAHLCSW
jgi:hypothetical protein